MEFSPETSGLYFHIPYCRKACHYCDFHFSTQLQSVDEMVLQMTRELEIRAQDWKWPRLHSVYFGGGTPSILEPRHLDSIFSAIHRFFQLEEGAEITLEANPDDFQEDRVKAWKELGINRLSIGLQSSREERLTWMNRSHSLAAGPAAIELARNSGIEKLSLDLMYQFPDSPLSELESDLDWLLSFAPEHISAYGLTIEPTTAFGKWAKLGKLKGLPEEEAARQFRFVREKLASAGFEGYEISNFARSGNYARHNTAYWFQRPYLGIGPGAHGFDGAIRWENKPNNPLYIKNLSQGQLLEEKEILEPQSYANEMILTRLRTIWGLPLHELKERTGIDLRSVSAASIQSFQKEGWLLEDASVLYLTEEGKVMADYMAMELMV